MDTITTKEIHVAYYATPQDSKPLHVLHHIVWDLERFTDRLNKEAADNREKGEGFTHWMFRP